MTADPQEGSVFTNLPAESLNNETRRALEQKDQIAVVFKEYDLLAKKEEQVTTFMQDVCKVTGLAFVGLCIAAKTDLAGFIGIVCAPVLIMGLLGVVAHCREIILRTGRSIASIENKVFIICGEPLLTFYTKLAINRSRKSLVPWCIGIPAGLLVYALSIHWIVDNIFWPHLFPYSSNKREAQAAYILLISVAILIALYPMRKVLKALAGRRRFDCDCKLAQKLESNGGS